MQGEDEIDILFFIVTFLLGPFLFIAGYIEGGYYQDKSVNQEYVDVCVKYGNTSQYCWHQIYI